MRLNRTNVALVNRPWFVAPTDPDAWHINDLSPFADKIDAPGERTIHINLNEQAFAAYNKEGYLVTWGPAAGASGYCADLGRSCNTVVGTFRMFRKKGEACKSSKYPLGKGGAPMPFCMFFHKGFAMHASTMPGYPASHGCVRMFLEDAAWLNKGFIKVGGGGTRVVVTKS